MAKVRCLCYLVFLRPPHIRLGTCWLCTWLLRSLSVSSPGLSLSPPVRPVTLTTTLRIHCNFKQSTAESYCFAVDWILVRSDTPVLTIIIINTFFSSCCWVFECIEHSLCLFISELRGKRTQLHVKSTDHHFSVSHQKNDFVSTWKPTELALRPPFLLVNIAHWDTCPVDIRASWMRLCSWFIFTWS